MEILVSQAQGRVPVTVLHVRGEINVGSYGQFQAEAERAIQAGTTHLLIDLAATPYISSAGLRALTHIYNLLRDKSGEGQESVGPGLRDGTYCSPHLKLLDPTPQVQKVLAASGYDMFLESYDDYEQAVKAF